MTTLPPHVEENAILLEDLQLAYVPVPKAGSTAMLWALLGLVEREQSGFTTSAKAEVTRSLTIHDMSMWGREHRLAGRRAAETGRIFGSADWLVFTVVREPLRRIWSAWVNKILLQEPRFVAAYGGQTWFPESPRSAHDVVISFRRFAEALSERPDAWPNRHWSPQTELLGIGEVDYDLIGRVEYLARAVEVIDAHLRLRGQNGLEVRRANSSLVSFVPEVLDHDSWERCAAMTAHDREVFGYEPAPRGLGEPDARWVAEVEARIPVIQAVIERNARIGDLSRLVMDTRASSSLASLPAVVGP